MNYKEFQPDPLLTGFVKNYWWFDNSTDKPFDLTILPDGYFDLILSFENYRQNGISLTGIWTRQVDVSIDPNSQLFGVRFKLLAVDYVIRHHIASFCNSEQIQENDFWQLNNLSFTNLESVAENMNMVILSILSSQKSIDSRKQNLFDLLYKTNGGQTIEKYSRQVGWTSRQINRYFKERFGIPLKSYCRILRCFASYRHIKEGKFYPEQNYFDQSHFIKDLKEHTGNNPKALFENKNDRFLQLATMKEK